MIDTRCGTTPQILAVNPQVRGSNPPRGAIRSKHLGHPSGWLFCFLGIDIQKVRGSVWGTRAPCPPISIRPSAGLSKWSVMHGALNTDESGRNDFSQYARVSPAEPLYSSDYVVRWTKTYQ